jgi:hypothetical protein
VRERDVQRKGKREGEGRGKERAIEKEAMLIFDKQGSIDTRCEAWHPLIFMFV